MMADSKRRAMRAFESGAYQGEYLTYSSPAQLFAALPPKRWELIERLLATGPSSLRGLARDVGRDVKRVHEDASALLAEGIFERDARKRLFVPYAKIEIRANLITPAKATGSSGPEVKAAA